jgi:excisionase family DNA binding protein
MKTSIRYTTDEVADRLGIDRVAVSAMMHRGDLPYKKMNGRFLVDKRDLDKVLDQRLEASLFPFVNEYLDYQSMVRTIRDVNVANVWSVNGLSSLTAFLSEHRFWKTARGEAMLQPEEVEWLARRAVAGAEDFLTHLRAIAAIHTHGPMIFIPEGGGFYIDKYPVTNWQFRRFINDIGHKTDAESKKDGSLVWGTFTSRESGKVQSRSTRSLGATWRSPVGDSASVKARPDHPVVHVSFHDALAYCKYAGKQLPTLSQWRLAAASPRLQAQIFPFEEEVWDPTKANLEHAVGETTAVTLFPGGCTRRGIYDLAGNIMEWIASPGTAPGEEQGGKVERAIDNIGKRLFGTMFDLTTVALASAKTKGGSWRDDSWHGKILAEPASFVLNYTDNCVGFRCVKPLSGALL